MLRPRFLLFALALGLCAVSPSAAGAAAGPPVVVSVESPSGEALSYFKIEGRPDRAVTAGRLVLRNRTERRIRVLLDPVDAETASTLGSAYKVRGARVYGPGLWTRLSSRRVALAPRGSLVVPVTVRVPEDAKAGDHLSGISVQAITKPKTKKVRSNVAVASVYRYAVGLQVAIPGPRRPRIKLTGARVERQPAGLVFLLEARNSGNVILQGVTGKIRVLRAGRVVARQDVQPGTFVTATEIEYPVAARGQVPPEGTDYQVQATLRYPGGSARLGKTVRFGARQAKAQETFGGPRARAGDGGGGGVPWLPIAGGAAGALGLMALVNAVQRRRRVRGESASRLGCGP